MNPHPPYEFLEQAQLKGSTGEIAFLFGDVSVKTVKELHASSVTAAAVRGSQEGDCPPRGVGSSSLRSLSWLGVALRSQGDSMRILMWQSSLQTEGNCWLFSAILFV